MIIFALGFKKLEVQSLRKMTFNSASNIIFDNDAFWQALGSKHLSPVYSLGKLHNMLSLSRTLRAELLELPVLEQDKEAKKEQKKRGQKAIAKAEELLFKQPLSILHRAVHSMFAFNPLSHQTYVATSLSVQTAARQFAMPIPEIRSLIR